MENLTPELREKFKKFRNSYEWAIVWLADAGGNAERKARDAWLAATREVPVTEMEEDLFRRLMERDAKLARELRPAEHNPPSIPKPEE